MEKCYGKGLVHILAVIAPELAAQAAESYDDSHRLARSYLQSRSPLVIWQTLPYVYSEGEFREDSQESVKAELNLHIKHEFNSLGLKKTPNVTNIVVNNAFSAAAANVFDREQSAPHWLKASRLPGK